MTAFLKKRKKLLAGTVLLLLTALALGTMAFADGGGSYALTIQKIFADGAPDQAKNMTYTFRVEAQVKSDMGYEPVEKIVKITGDGTATISFENAFKISVIEQTNDGGFKLEGEDWDVTKTECVSSMHVGASQATVNISKDGGMIRVTRPAGVPDVTFLLTGKPLHDDKQTEFDKQFSPQTVTVSAGETKELGTDLPQGQYTITKLRSVDGFSVLVGPREFDVAAGQEGKVHINGSDSKLSIIAPAADSGTPEKTHHYRVSGRTSTGTWVERDIDVRSGQTGTVDNLAEGDYDIQVSETYDGIKGYTVTVPQTTETADRSSNSSALYTGSSGSCKTFTVSADYVEVYGFGPLLNASNKSVSGTYKFYFGTYDPETDKIPLYTFTGSSGTVSYTLNSPRRLPVSNGKVYFKVLNVTNADAKKLTVKWREYTETETEKTITNPSAEGDVVTVDDRGWLTISKPEDTSQRGSEVKYYYTITDSNEKNISDFTVTGKDGDTVAAPTDKDGTTVMLHAGESMTISGLPGGGNYRIKETVQDAPAMGFRVKLDDTSKSVTVTGGSIHIETLGERTVEIQRWGDPKDDGNRLYTYEVYKDGEQGIYRTIKLHSGETATIAEQLPVGGYQIQAVDDQIVGFDVAFSDSSSLTSDYIRQATVAFTNHFAPVQASYHVVHEYYLKNEDGSYTFEGASPVFTKNCDGSHDESAGHYSKDVHLLDVYGGHTYTHFSDAYGKVVSWPKGGTPKEVELDAGVDLVYDGPLVKNGTGSNGSGSMEDPGTRDYAYKPLTNLTCAMATKHDAETGAHDGGAQIIILRYEREETLEEQGKYNVIHVYYQRTSSGDKWEGTSALEQINIGTLTNENRYTTYDASGVDPVLRFTPRGSDVEYPYTYDGAAYGRLVESDNDGSYPGEGVVGEGKEYRKDDTMTSVKATPEGDQIIILRYYRSGGYNVVHEYYYREKADQVEDPGEVGEVPGEDAGGGSEPEDQRGSVQARDGGDGFSGTLTNSGGYTYDFEGKSAISKYSDSLESRHDAGEVTREPRYSPEGEQYTYTYKDAVYGYLDKATGTYRLAPYMTGVTATAQDDEIIILRYYRGEGGTTPDPPVVFLPDPSPTPEPSPGPSEGPSPEPTLEPSETPTPEPTPEPSEAPTPEPALEPSEAPSAGPEPSEGPISTPEPTPAPSYPPGLPDPNDPDSPEEITIWDDDIPLTFFKTWDPEAGEWVWVPKEDVPGPSQPPTTPPPPTGDDSGLGMWLLLCAASTAGLSLLCRTGGRKKTPHRTIAP